MPVQYRIDNNVVEFIMTDGYTFDEFKAVCSEVLVDANFSPCMKGLANLMNARPNPPTHEIRAGAVFLGRLKIRFTATWAILAPPDSLTYGLARMFAVFAESNGIQLEVFTERAEALAYLARRPVPMTGVDAPCPIENNRKY